MNFVKYKKNKYTKHNREWYILGEPPGCCIGNLVKLKTQDEVHQEIIKKLEKKWKE